MSHIFFLERLLSYELKLTAPPPLGNHCGQPAQNPIYPDSMLRSWRILPVVSKARTC